MLAHRLTILTLGKVTQDDHKFQAIWGTQQVQSQPRPHTKKLSPAKKLSKQNEIYLKDL